MNSTRSVCTPQPGLQAVGAHSYVHVRHVAVCIPNAVSRYTDLACVTMLLSYVAVMLRI